MYNGIGLSTVRGSGTNGYVQRNLSLLRNVKTKSDYKTEDELNALEQKLRMAPNAELIDHDRKRKIELKCLEMQSLMDEQGYSEEEIDNKVKLFREMLLEKEKLREAESLEFDDSGRPIAKSSHKLKEAQQAKCDQLRAALGISEYYVEGTAMDPNRKQKEAEAKELARKQYSLVNEPEEALAEEKNDAEEFEKEKDPNESENTEEPERKRSRHHHRDRDSSRRRHRHHRHHHHHRKRHGSGSSGRRRRRHDTDETSDKEERSNKRHKPDDADDTKSKGSKKDTGSKKRQRSSSRSSRSLSYSPDEKNRDSRSPSIRRRSGSPSHLDRRRITRSKSPSPARHTSTSRRQKRR